MIDFASGAPVTGSLDVTWNHGTPGRRGDREPKIQVHYYDEHTVILRQSKCVHYEAPFLFLLFGNDRALLLDTGATADPGRFPLRAKVDRLVAIWLARNPREGYGLVVAPTGTATMWPPTNSSPGGPGPRWCRRTRARCGRSSGSATAGRSGP